MAADGELQREFQREITVNGGPCCLPSGSLKLFMNGMKREHGIPLTIKLIALQAARKGSEVWNFVQLERFVVSNDSFNLCQNVENWTKLESTCKLYFA